MPERFVMGHPQVPVVRLHDLRGGRGLCTLASTHSQLRTVCALMI